MASWKSGLWISKKSTKGLLTNPGYLNYAMLSQCKNVIEHFSCDIDSYLSMTHHKLSSLNLQCLSSCSNLVSIPKNLIIEVVEWLLAGLNILSNLLTGFAKILIYQVFCLANLNKNLDGSVLVILPFNSIIKEQVRNWLSLTFLLSFEGGWFRVYDRHFTLEVLLYFSSG